MTQNVCSALWSDVEIVALEYEHGEAVKVDKAAFDAVLRKLAHSGPLKKSEVKTDKTKPGKLIPPQQSKHDRPS